MPDEPLSTYLHTRPVETAPSPSLDYLPVIKPDGTVKQSKISTITGRVIGGGGGDVTSIGGAADFSTLTDGNVGNIAGATGSITALTVKENSVVYSTVTNKQTFTYHATNLPIRGNTNVEIRPGDTVILLGLAGDIGSIIGWELKDVQYIPRIDHITTSPSITPDCGSFDRLYVTALNEVTAAFQLPAGTPRDGQGFRIRIKAAALSGTSFDDYTFIGCVQPSDIQMNETVFVDMEYSEDNTTWYITDVKKQTNPVARMSDL
jgi:hypothetical protein